MHVWKDDWEARASPAAQCLWSQPSLSIGLEGQMVPVDTIYPSLAWFVEASTLFHWSWLVEWAERHLSIFPWFAALVLVLPAPACIFPSILRWTKQTATRNMAFGEGVQLKDTLAVLEWHLPRGFLSDGRGVLPIVEELVSVSRRSKLGYNGVILDFSCRCPLRQWPWDLARSSLSPHFPESLATLIDRGYTTGVRTHRVLRRN